jgi:hypothetical protein
MSSITCVTSTISRLPDGLISTVHRCLARAVSALHVPSADSSVHHPRAHSGRRSRPRMARFFPSAATAATSQPHRKLHPRSYLPTTRRRLPRRRRALRPLERGWPFDGKRGHVLTGQRPAAEHGQRQREVYLPAWSASK